MSSEFLMLKKQAKAQGIKGWQRMKESTLKARLKTTYKMPRYHVLSSDQFSAPANAFGMGIGQVRTYLQEMQRNYTIEKDEIAAMVKELGAKPNPKSCLVVKKQLKQFLDDMEANLQTYDAQHAALLNHLLDVELIKV
jgi:hypothetical protein